MQFFVFEVKTATVVFSFQILCQAGARSRLQLYVCMYVCMYVCIVVKQESFPLHYANAQLQLDGGLYHCELIFCSGLCPVVMRRRQWQCTFVWGLPEESRTSSVRSTQCKVRYRACVHDIVCVLHCYLRKRPGPVPRFSLSKLSTIACCTCVLCLVCLLHFVFCSDSQSGWCLFSWSFPSSEIWGLE